MYHTTPFQNMFFMGFSIFILLLSVVIIIIGIILIHDLPYHIARRRNHPQQDAIRCMAVMGLVLFPLWLLSMVWAYMRSGVSYFGAEHQNSTTYENDNEKDAVETEANENEDGLDTLGSDTDNSQKDDRDVSLKKTVEVVEENSESTDKTQIQE